MRILIIDVVTAPDVLKTKAALTSAGHQVELVAPEDGARLHSLVRQSFDAIVMEWLENPSAVEILETVATLEDDGPACIICTAKATAANIEAAFRAGADDFIKKPFLLEQLRGRLDRVLAQQQALAAAAARGDRVAQTAVAGVICGAAWQSFSSLAARGASGVTMLPIALTGCLPAMQPWLAATMVLSVASAHLEFRTVVDGDRDSLEKLAMAAVGSSTEAAVNDLLSEVANTVGGEFMRAAADEQLVVTSGLPSTITAGDAKRAIDAATQMITCWMSDEESGAHLRVRFCVRVRKNRFVKVLALHEGMVLATDLRTSEGTVLLTAGTRVTSSATERLRRILDARRMIEVADTAA